MTKHSKYAIGRFCLSQYHNSMSRLPPNNKDWQQLTPFYDNCSPIQNSHLINYTKCWAWHFMAQKDHWEFRSHNAYIALSMHVSLLLNEPALWREVSRYGASKCLVVFGLFSRKIYFCKISNNINSHKMDPSWLILDVCLQTLYKIAGNKILRLPIHFAWS